MKKIYIVLLLAFSFLACYTCARQSKNIKPEIGNMGKNRGIADRQSESEPILDLPEPDLLEGWLGSYEQNGILRDEISGSFDFYIYRENGKYYGYLCVHGSETGTSCYFDERILTEIRGNQDVIQVCFLEKQQLIQGCHHEEYPDIFGIECGTSKLDEAIRDYENQDVLFTLKRDEDACSVVEEKMLLGRNQEGEVNGFSQCSQLTIDNICDKDREIFLTMFREKEQLSEKEQPDYSGYDNDGELILNLYLNLEQKRGMGIYFGETQISRYITQFDIDSWQPGVWEDNKYSLMRAEEEAATTLDEYQEYREYNDQGQITSFYSEGIITGWGNPQKEKLVQIEFSYGDNGILEKKSCRYNHRLYGTTRQSETFYFDTEERLIFTTAYVTYGALTDHYFYEDGKEEPIACLTLDHMGHQCYGKLVWYDNTCTDNTQSSLKAQMWQDAYAAQLRGSLGNDFFLCDIDSNGIPELLIGGPSIDSGKYANYDVYTYGDNTVECLGKVVTLSWSSLWLDDNGGVLGYSYGAGGGETYRYYIDNGVLCYDGVVYGYDYDSDGNCTEWFRGADGSKMIVNEATKSEYENIWNSQIELERYTITEDEISMVIYGGS